MSKEGNIINLKYDAILLRKIVSLNNRTDYKYIVNAVCKGTLSAERNAWDVLIVNMLLL